MDDVIDCPHSVDDLTRVFELGAHSLKLHSLKGGSVHTVKHSYCLGHEVYTTGRISETTTRKIVDVAREHERRGTIAIATSAVRDAENRMSFVRQLQTTLQIAVRVLTGWEEASLLATGYLAQSSKLPVMVVDIGGGSLELVFLNRTQTLLWDSLPLGAIRLYCRGLRNGSSDPTHWIGTVFKKAAIVKSDEVYATGGTVAAIAKTLKRSTFSRRDLEALGRRVSTNGPPPELKPERARVFLPGLLLARKLLDFIGAERLNYLKISVGKTCLSLSRRLLKTG